MMKKITGFTLIELVVTMLVASILLMVGIPTFIETMRRNRTASQANELVTALNLARSEAITRGMQVTVATTGTEWEEGWQVFTDENGDGVVDAGDTVLQEYEALSEGYTLRTDGSFTDWVGYLPEGLSRGGGGLANDTFQLCTDEQEAAEGRDIAVNVVGRITVREGATACP